MDQPFEFHIIETDKVWYSNVSGIQILTVLPLECPLFRKYLLLGIFLYKGIRITGKCLFKFKETRPLFRMSKVDNTTDDLNNNDCETSCFLDVLIKIYLLFESCDFLLQVGQSSSVLGPTPRNRLNKN